MKRILRWLCPALFLLICAGMIWALHRFVVVNGHMEYITWDSSVQILSDGTEVPFETNTYSNISDAKGSYRFSSHLPEGLPEGSLIFETSGCSVTLSLNGTEIYRSSAATSPGCGVDVSGYHPSAGGSDRYHHHGLYRFGLLRSHVPASAAIHAYIFYRLTSNSSCQPGRPSRRGGGTGFPACDQSVSAGRHVAAAGPASAPAHGRRSWTDFLSDDPGTGISFSPGSRLAVFQPTGHQSRHYFSASSVSVCQQKPALFPASGHRDSVERRRTGRRLPCFTLAGQLSVFLHQFRGFHPDKQRILRRTDLLADPLVDHRLRAPSPFTEPCAPSPPSRAIWRCSPCAVS